MKFLRILPLAGLALLAVSCQNGSGNLSENSSQTDSLMYYLGQMHAADYLREASRDTVLKESSEKQAYLTGVRAGLAALKEGNESYNKGVMMGMQMASQIMSFTEQMGVEVNKNAYVGSLQSALMADTMPNSALIQSQFRTVMTNIEKAKDERDKAASQESLKQVAEASDFPKISDDLYGKVTEANNDTVKLAEGDEINLIVKISKEDGEVVNVPLPPKGKIGNKRNYPEIVSEAILKLKSGETGEYLTTAYALMGNRAKQQGLEPNDVLKLTLTPTLLPKEEDKEK